MSGVGSSPVLATYETSQVLFAGGLSWGSPVFAPPNDWPVSHVLTLEMDGELNSS